MVNFEPDWYKVVLYKHNIYDIWTHAARLIAEGVEHSKFGGFWDGSHSCGVLFKTGSGRDLDSYGVPYAFMKRKEKNPTACITTGSIETDADLVQNIESASERSNQIIV